MDGITFTALMIAAAMGGAGFAYAHCAHRMNQLKRAAVITGETMLKTLSDIRDMSLLYPQLMDHFMPIMKGIAEGFDKATKEASNDKD